MNIRVEVIPHEKQRYDTCGDWWYEGRDLVVKVSKLQNWRQETLVALHEIIEAVLCKARGITEKSVTDFDVAVLATDYNGEPGDLPEAPYRREHFFATNLERLIATELEIDWLEYEKAVNYLGAPKGE